MLDRTPETPGTVTAPWPKNPYPGLRPFHVDKSADESLIFYGRNADKDNILQRLNANHLVFVVGPSGCGKSSLVKAGVVPALEAGLLTHAGDKWQVAEMRPGERPLRHLAGALARLRPNDGDTSFARQVYKVLLKDETGLWLVIETLFPRSGPARPVLLLIDQFEEVFGPQIVSQDEASRFSECLVRFFEKPHPNLYCIVTMRTDFLGQCANLPKLADAINATLFVTPVLRHSELDKVIALPPEDYHGELDPKLTAAIIEEMTADTRYNPDHLPLMQHVLLWLWNKAVAATGTPQRPRPDQPPPPQPIRLTCDDYRDFDGLKGILNRHAEEVLGRLDERGWQIAEVLFRRLSERDAENRYRRSPARASAICALARCSRAELDAVVATFADPDVAFVDRRPIADGDDELLDVSHESLIRQWDRLRKWADDEAERIRRFRDLACSAARWERQGRSTDFFKGPDELQYWENWWKRKNLTPAWIERYRLHQVEGKPAPDLFGLTEKYLRLNRKHVAWQRILFFSSLAAVIALAWVGSALFIDRENQKTLRQLRQAEARVLATRGEEALERDGASRALLIAIHGLSGPTYVPELERLAYKALQDLREQQIFSVDNQWASSSFSPDGETLLMMDKGKLKFWGMKDNRLVGETTIPGYPAAVRPIWSDNGEWIIANSGDSRTVLFVPCTHAELRALFARCEGESEDVTQVIGRGEPSWPSKLNPDGSFLLSGGFGAPPKLWDLRRRDAEPLQLHDKPAGFAVAFHPYKNLLAVGGIDGSVRIHDSENPGTPLHVLTIRQAGPGDPSCSTPGAAMARQVELPVSSIAFHPTHPDKLVATTNDGHVRVWDFVEERVLCRASIRSAFITAAFNPTGDLIAITSEDGPLVWNLKIGEVVTLRGHRRATWMVDFRPTNGTRENSLASTSIESTRIWRMRAALHPTPANPDEVARVSGSVVTDDKPLQIHDRVRGKHVEFRLPRHALAAVSPAGTHVLVASRDANPKNAALMLYDSAMPSQVIAEFTGPATEWKSVGFMSEPDRIVVVTQSGVAYSWRYFRTPRQLIEFARESLPELDGQRADLPLEEQCRYGIRQASACREMLAAQGAARPGPN